MYMFLFCILVSTIVQNGFAALTESQMKSAAKLMRNTCQPKSKVLTEAIEEMQNGIFNANAAAGCYMHCILKMMKVVQADGKIDIESARKQVQTLPDNRQVPTLLTIDNCEKQIDENAFDDKCKLAFEIAKCMYMDNPKNYFLP